MVMLDQSHPLANYKILTIPMVAQHPMVSIDRTMSSWDANVERMFEHAGQTPRWTKSTAFGVVAGGDMVAGGVATLLVLESVAADQPQGRVFRPLTVPWKAGWLLSRRVAPQDLPAVATAITAARIAPSAEPSCV